ncbi:helix-turn-helix transcriptional regulator [bacterium]|nr:helix-turn-helix transcriptional regulator [bacterium]
MASHVSIDKPTELRGSRVEPAFMTVPELAELLHVNEKKIYQLAGCGEIPGTKVTGKWIFPRRLIDDWLLENSHGGVMHDRLLIAGSDDRLVYQICNHAAIDWQQQALLSYSPSGTRHGLQMLDAGRIDACFINWGATEISARRHMGLLRCYRNHASWIIVRCLQRTQGLITNQSRMKSIPANTSELINNPDLRWAMRQSDSGAARLLEDLCSGAGKSMSRLQVSTTCNSEISAAAAVNTGVADVYCGLQCTARDFSLDFLPAATVSLDLVMSRKTYFRTLMQDFIKRLLNEDTGTMAEQLSGYMLMPTADLVTLEIE